MVRGIAFTPGADSYTITVTPVPVPTPPFLKSFRWNRNSSGSCRTLSLQRNVGSCADLFNSVGCRRECTNNKEVIAEETAPMALTSEYNSPRETQAEPR